MNPVLSASLLAGALASDNRSSLRLMVSQPVCGGLLAGFALGNPREGLLAGAVLQMLFLGLVPVRGIGMSDLALGGVAASSLYILALRSAAVDPAAKGLVLLLSLAAALGVAAAGSCVYRFWESRAHVFTDAALRLAGRGRFGLASAGKWAEPLAGLPVLLPFIGAGSLLALNLGRVRGFLFLAGFCTVMLVLVFRS
jgi:mannose/fructose/N-acetylgalactosamine-specific phosphotransferase system component IIC